MSKAKAKVNAPKSAMAIQAATDLFVHTQLTSCDEYLAEHWETYSDEETNDLIDKFYGTGKYESDKDTPFDVVFESFIEERLDDFTDAEVSQIIESADARIDDDDYRDAYMKIANA